jgi:NAD(P)-dependent dehydrogenase (short-subunit alcohol dehydrogenase family)
MVKRVLIIGGYGNFGSYIARSLAGEANIQLVVGGRSLAKARQFAARLRARHEAEAIALDIHGDLAARLVEARPDIVIHTTGPFQNQSYVVAEACIEQGCHYVDLADARRFVRDISRLDPGAKARGVLVVSGASSVPCLTAAIVDQYRPRFRALDRIEYGISAAQQTNRGLATTAAILSYVGKPFATLINGAARHVYGWQDLHAETYPELGRRWFGNCDIPDLDLFPKRYAALKTIRFSAGHEIALLHLGLWLLSWPVRFGVLPALDRLAGPLLRASFWFDRFGSGRSGLHMFLHGTGLDGEAKTARCFIVARSGHGPYIPCMPTILLAKMLASGNMPQPGARPCLDMIDLPTYLDALKGLDISVIEDSAHG